MRGECITCSRLRSGVSVGPSAAAGVAVRPVSSSFGLNRLPWPMKKFMLGGVCPTNVSSAHAEEWDVEEVVDDEDPAVDCAGAFMSEAKDEHYTERSEESLRELQLQAFEEVLQRIVM